MLLSIKGCIINLISHFSCSLWIFFQIQPTGAPCAAPIVNLSVGRIERYQVSHSFLNLPCRRNRKNDTHCVEIVGF